MTSSFSVSPAYWFKIQDHDGCTHSVDRLVLDYFLCCGECETAIESIIPVFEQNASKFDRENRIYCHTGRKASSKYDWFAHFLSADGMACKIGLYTDYDRESKKFHLLPIIRLDFNPNKRHGTRLHDALFEWLAENATDGVISRLDYAVDVPCGIDAVLVESRKKRGLYEGTQYYGKRHSHSALKVYNKAVEQGKAFVESVCKEDRPAVRRLVSETVEKSPLTRCEWTIRRDKPICLDSISWFTSGPAPLPDLGTLSAQTFSLLQLVRLAVAHGVDPRECFEYLDSRTVKKIEPFAIGTGKRLVACDGRLFSSLVDMYCSVYSISASFGEVKTADGAWPAFTIGRPSSIGSLVPDTDDEELPF